MNQHLLDQLRINLEAVSNATEELIRAQEAAFRTLEALEDEESPSK